MHCSCAAVKAVTGGNQNAVPVERNVLIGTVLWAFERFGEIISRM
jgi:hypothetical protein